MITRRAAVVPAVGAAMALVLAACGGGGGGGDGDEAAGKPRQGGTLELIGSSDVDHLDPTSDYYTVGYTLERAFTRQLFQYKASKNFEEEIDPQPDVAKELPTQENGGISKDRKTYTIHLRDGVMWNTNPPREVTAQDFERGFKRLCNPASPSGALGYYTDTIAGMSEYCDEFAKVEGTASAIAKFMNSHDVEGVHAKDDKTIVFKLKQPASDFLQILALPFGSAVPKEYMKYVPDSAEFRQHTLSDGPYYIAKYSPNKEYLLKPNKAWKQSTDPLRHQYLDAIHITLGQNDESTVLDQVEAGDADFAFDLPVPTSAIPRLKAAGDDNLGFYETHDTNPFLRFNLQSPNNDGAMKKLKVRQAIAYAIDKTSTVKIYGGPDLGTPLDQVIPPGNLGYQQFNMYPTPGHKGDPAKCKQLLAEAGYKPGEIVLKDVVRNAGNHPDIAQSVQADLKKCGITVKINLVSQGDYYGKYLGHPDQAKRGDWDISEPGWIPDWFGNNGRAVIEPLFDGRHYGLNSTDWGGYNSDKVNELIDKALTASSEAEAAKYWHQADVQIMNDAVFVPFKTEKLALYHSDRVENALYFPYSQNFDITNLWLSK